MLPEELAAQTDSSSKSSATSTHDDVSKVSDAAMPDMATSINDESERASLAASETQLSCPPHTIISVLFAEQLHGEW